MTFYTLTRNFHENFFIVIDKLNFFLVGMLVITFLYNLLLWQKISIFRILILPERKKYGSPQNLFAC